MESKSALPFSRLSANKYLTIEVLKNIKFAKALTFMVSLNKHARAFMYNNYDTFRNEFVNYGLIEHFFDSNGSSHFYIFD